MNWVSVYHLKLDGFVHDMTMDGANNFLKAIKLFESSKNDL